MRCLGEAAPLALQHVQQLAGALVQDARVARKGARRQHAGPVRVARHARHNACAPIHVIYIYLLVFPESRLRTACRLLLQPGRTRQSGHFILLQHMLLVLRMASSLHTPLWWWVV